MAISTYCAAVLNAAGIDWRGRFEVEAPAAWEEYQKANRFTQGVLRNEGEGTGLPRQRSETEWKVNETCQLARITDLVSGSSEVFAENPQYSFSLKSAGDRGWVLVSLHLTGQKEDGQAQTIRRRLREYSLEFEAAVRLDPDGQLLSEIVRSGKTRIKTVTPKEQGDRELVEVQFDYTPGVSEPRKLLGGLLLLDPAREWLPVTYTTSVKTGVGTGKHSVEFEFGQGSHPQPRRVRWRQEYTLSSQAEPWLQAGTSEREVRVSDRLPETREFTLTAFGLPEPVGVTWEKPTPRYIWFIVAAVVFGMLAVGFRYLARRRSTSVTE